jgi:hypothetical protein
VSEVSADLFGTVCAERDLAIRERELAARAVDVLERVGEQARQRIVELTSALREACDLAEAVGPHHDKLKRLRALADRAAAETPAPKSWAEARATRSR